MSPRQPSARNRHRPPQKGKTLQREALRAWLGPTLLYTAFCLGLVSVSVLATRPIARAIQRWAAKPQALPTTKELHASEKIDGRLTRPPLSE
jgi:hypothetical protein